MNVDAVRRLARHMRELPDERLYDQRRWFDLLEASPECGTPACIAGHQAMLEGWSPSDESGFCRRPGDRPLHVEIIARGTLGLRSETCDWLFSAHPKSAWPSPFASRWSRAERERSGERLSTIAADLLDALADGRVR